MSTFDLSEIAEIAKTLEIRPPTSASDRELTEWRDWWRDSAAAARSMPLEIVTILKAGGWWPPLTARHINEPSPLIVRKMMRPKLFDSPETSSPPSAEHPKG